MGLRSRSMNITWIQKNGHLIQSEHRGPTHSLCVTDCFFFYGKCIGFTVCLSHSDILEDLTETETVIKKSLTPRVRQSHFSPENRIAPLSSFAGKMSKDSRFFSYLPIENPSKRPEANPPRKLKSDSFWTVKMRSKILMCQPQTVPLIASFWLADWRVKISSKIHTCQSETVLLIASVLIGYR